MTVFGRPFIAILFLSEIWKSKEVEISDLGFNYNFKIVKLYNTAVSWQIAKLRLPNPEV